LYSQKIQKNDNLISSKKKESVLSRIKAKHANIIENDRRIYE